MQSGSLQPHDQFAGHHKSETYSDDWFITPFDEDCAIYFKYALMGLVEVSPDLDASAQIKADKTIQALNLNADYLVACRKKSLQALNHKIEALLAENSLPNLKSEPSNLSDREKVARFELSQLAKDSLELSDKKLPEFYSAKKQLFASVMKYENGLSLLQLL